MNKYFSIARIDHWPKNIMMIPGALLGILVDELPLSEQTLFFLMAFFGTCLVASANYTINEFLDKDFDRHHPGKKTRALVDQDISAKAIALQYSILAGAGLLLLYPLHLTAFCGGLSLLFMGVVYNVSPMRTKEVVYLDVLSESINNPIRLIIGWGAVTSIILPPMSLMLCFWFGGAFLMATKRYSEFRYIGSPALASKYRKSFEHYTELSLLLSSFFYALLSIFMLAIFLIKYRSEFLFCFPFIAIIFTWYLSLSHKLEHSIAMEPEKIYQNRPYFAFVLLTCSVALALFLIDIPIANFIADHQVKLDHRWE